MAREKMETRKLTGAIRVACKYDDGTTRYWDTPKEEVVAHIIDVVNEYSAEGYTLTLRQLHYQLVTQNWIVNHDTAYKKLGGILDDCRYGGVIDWNAIEDRGRVPYIPYSVKDVPDALQDTIDQYRIDRQRGQINHVELWTEKDALSGILKRTTQKYHIRLVVNKGYTSSSALYGAYKRCVQEITAGKKVTILYFGDHDPSGLDMIRDIRERLLLFLCNGTGLSCGDYFHDNIQTWWDEEQYTIHDLVDNDYMDALAAQRMLDGEARDNEDDLFEQGKIRMYLAEKELFTVLPIGLTMKQITQYKLPPNPTKLTDTRSGKYVAKFGKTCWEVDALKPQVLTAIVEKNIKEQIDMDVFAETVEAEAADIEKLQAIVDNLSEDDKD
jgi:hypothetical protein